MSVPLEPVLATLGLLLVLPLACKLAEILYFVTGETIFVARTRTRDGRRLLILPIF
eukprot:SAG31_NODE_243_length_19342_cov_12.906459_4_plen_56_part_00